MNPILTQILAHKAEEVARLAKERDLETMADAVRQAPATRGFEAALRSTVAGGACAVIAEMKRASPSQGVLRADFDAAKIARSYIEHGATCLSVLTDEHYFHGSQADLRAVRETCALPILRKDFIIDPWQVYETRLMGADCLLLIVAALSQARLEALYQLAGTLGLDVLVEVHDAQELSRAQELGAGLVGINNRDLNTFETSIEVSLQLMEQVTSTALVVSESGIHSREDVARLRDAGIHAFLIGEALMRAPDPGRRLFQIFG